jgi:hypothetical protein
MQHIRLPKRFAVPSIFRLELRSDKGVSLVNRTTADWGKIVWLIHLEADICAERRLSPISC